MSRINNTAIDDMNDKSSAVTLEISMNCSGNVRIEEDAEMIKDYENILKYTQSK